MIEDLYNEIEDLEDELEYVDDSLMIEKGSMPSMADIEKQQGKP